MHPYCMMPPPAKMRETCKKVPRIFRLLYRVLLWQHRTIPALRPKHRSDGCGTASALPKCSIMSGCGTRIVLRGQKPLALCDRCLCFGSLFPPLAALTFAASSIICAFGLASAVPRLPYRHLELCGIAFNWLRIKKSNSRVVPTAVLPLFIIIYYLGEIVCNNWSPCTGPTALFFPLIPRPQPHSKASRCPAPAASRLPPQRRPAHTQ